MRALAEQEHKDKNMSIKDIYKKIGGATQKLTGKLSDVFSDRAYYERGPDGNLNQVEKFSAQKPIVPQVPVQERKYQLADRGAEISDSDIQKMRPLIYGEVSNRDYAKKALEADVIMNTAINRQREYRKRGKNMSIADIVSMPNQYQAFGGDQYNRYHNPTNALELAKKKEVDAIVDMIAEKIKKGEYVDSTEGAFYYVHEKDGKVKYDNIKKLFK